jgi:hypothetical protein
MGVPIAAEYRHSRPQRSTSNLKPGLAVVLLLLLKLMLPRLLLLLLGPLLL